MQLRGNQRGGQLKNLLVVALNDSASAVCALSLEDLGLGHQQRARNHLIHMLIPHRIYVVLIDDLVLLEDAERVEASTVIVLRDFEALVL